MSVSSSIVKKETHYSWRIVIWPEGQCILDWFLWYNQVIRWFISHHYPIIPWTFMSEVWMGAVTSVLPPVLTIHSDLQYTMQIRVGVINFLLKPVNDKQVQLCNGTVIWQLLVIFCHYTVTTKYSGKMMAGWCWFGGRGIIGCLCLNRFLSFVCVLIRD